MFEVRGTQRERRGSAARRPRTPRARSCSPTPASTASRAARGLRSTARAEQSTRDRADVPARSSTPKQDVATSTSHGRLRDARRHAGRRRRSFDVACARRIARVRDAQRAARLPRVDTLERRQFNDWLDRSRRRPAHDDSPSTATGPYPYAGVPWFSTPFGRDGIITALAALWIDPDLARGVLALPGRDPGRRASTRTRDAEPGKILHEMRDGEMARARRGPVRPLLRQRRLDAAVRDAGRRLLRAHRRPRLHRSASGRTSSARSPGSSATATATATASSSTRRRSHDGLVQQGWKDSHDSVFHADGTLAEGPIALCEVQGYVYAARRGGRAARRTRSATTERARSAERAGRARCARASSAPSGARSSAPTRWRSTATSGRAACAPRTPGHCLFTGIAAARARARRVAADAARPDDVLRLGRPHARRRPRRATTRCRYHNGSIWPHDNALIAAGLARYGCKSDAHAILLARCSTPACSSSSQRLPELFCGFAARPGEGPTLYPVACAPQAWAAAAPLHAAAGRARPRRSTAPLGACASTIPCCRAFLNEIHIYNLRVGTSAVDLRLHRYPDDVGIHVSGRRGRDRGLCREVSRYGGDQRQLRSVVVARPRWRLARLARGREADGGRSAADRPRSR